MNELFQRVLAAGGRTIASNLVFDITISSPVIYDALCQSDPAIREVILELRHALVLSPAINGNAKAGIYRLPNHHRSICYALAAPMDGRRLDSSVCTLKGAEPLVPDYGQYLRWMTTARIRTEELPISECFPLGVGGAPGALTLYEARREQRITTQLHEPHLVHYGMLFHFVHRLTEEDNAGCAIHLRAVLSEAAFERVNPNSRPLAVSVFYYPHAPIRADFYTQIDTLRPGPTTRLSAGQMLDSWARAFARVLYLGYMPFAPWATGRGCCFDPGNAVIDGGITDCDSLVPVDMVADDLQFYRGFLWSIDCLRRSFAAVLGLADRDADPAFRYLSHSYVATVIEDALEAEARPELSIDPRVRHVLRNRSVESLFDCGRGRPLSTAPYESPSLERTAATEMQV